MLIYFVTVATGAMCESWIKNIINRLNQARKMGEKETEIKPGTNEGHTAKKEVHKKASFTNYQRGLTNLNPHN